MFRTAALAITLSLSAAQAQEVQCSDFDPITESHTALANIYGEMARWCVKEGITQPACQKLGQLSQREQIALRLPTAAATAAILARQCPPEITRSSKPSAQPE